MVSNGKTKVPKMTSRSQKFEPAFFRVGIFIIGEPSAKKIQEENIHRPFEIQQPKRPAMLRTHPYVRRRRIPGRTAGTFPEIIDHHTAEMNGRNMHQVKKERNPAEDQQDSRQPSPGSFRPWKHRHERAERHEKEKRGG